MGGECKLSRLRLRVDIPQISTRYKIITITGGLGLAALAAAVPLLGAGYLTRYLTKIFMWVALAESWNTITGYTYRVDFGHVVFLGTSAYISAMLILIWNFPWPLAALIAIATVVGQAIIVGLPTLRLTGAYFAIATWCVAEAFKWLFYLLPREISGGPNGLSISYYVEVSPILQFVLALAAAIMAILLNIFIEKSEIGYSLRAIKESEAVAETIGINTTKPKVLAYALSAITAGLVGFIYAPWVSYLHPFDAFDSLKTDMMVVMTLLGGIGTFLGPIIGSIFFLVIFEVFWTYFTNVIYQLLLGAVIMLTIIFLPNGILGILKRPRR